MLVKLVFDNDLIIFVAISPADLDGSRAQHCADSPIDAIEPLRTSEVRGETFNFIFPILHVAICHSKLYLETNLKNC